MFAKKNRLAKTKDVKAAIVYGRSFFNPFFTLKFLQGKAKVSRFTIVVSTKVNKKAVARNRIKRLAREFFRKNQSNLYVGDYALIVKPKIQALPETEFFPSLEKLLKQSKLLV